MAFIADDSKPKRIKENKMIRQSSASRPYSYKSSYIADSRNPIRKIFTSQEPKIKQAITPALIPSFEQSSGKKSKRGRDKNMSNQHRIASSSSKSRGRPASMGPHSSDNTPTHNVFGIKLNKNDESMLGGSNVYRISTMGNSITKPVKSLNLTSN